MEEQRESEDEISGAGIEREGEEGMGSDGSEEALDWSSLHRLEQPMKKGSK